ncbi:MAG: phytanoyl-CoA dioxygenase family protein [Cyanobium sp.]
MLPEAYTPSLTLAERLYRDDPETAQRIYSDAVFRFLRDGLVILPGVMDLDALDQLERDVNLLAENKSNPMLSWVEIDGPRDYYEARYLANLKTDDFRLDPPGLKLVNLQRFFDSAKALSFADPVMAFLDELFGSSPALIATITFWKGSQQPLHQDFSYVHHHRRLGELAATWIPLEDIQPDAGPLIYYQGTHFPERLGFFDWGGGSILASRDAPESVFDEYQKHLLRLIDEHHFQPSIFLPKRGDVLIWHGALIHGGTPMANPALTRRSLVCHYTTVGSHQRMQGQRVGSGFSFDEPPTLPYKPSRLRSFFRR